MNRPVSHPRDTRVQRAQFGSQISAGQVRVRVMGMVRVRVRVMVRSNVQRDRPQNVMAEANLDVPFHCDASFSMPPSIEM